LARHGEAPQYRQALSRQQAITLAASLQRRLLEAPKPLWRRYVRGLASNIAIKVRVTEPMFTTGLGERWSCHAIFAVTPFSSLRRIGA
jgi:hypothetical protein